MGTSQQAVWKRKFEFPSKCPKCHHVIPEFRQKSDIRTLKCQCTGTCGCKICKVCDNIPCECSWRKLT